MSTQSPEFILLTGALGSGKTTLLSDYLQSSDVSDTGVIINDAGEINVDGAVISADSRDLSVATLSNGCICCSMGNSVQEGIDALLQTRAERRQGPPRRILLETSGLAEPAPILRSLRQVRQMEFRLRVVATYDASTIRQRDNFPPQYAEQLAAAQVIVLTKLDTFSRELWVGRKADAHSFNPMASLICTTDRSARALSAFTEDIPQAPAAASIFQAREVANPRIRTALARWSRQATWDEVSEWIENLSAYLDPRLLRMKGLIRPAGFADAVLVNGVGGIFSPPRLVKGVSNGDLGLVMILRDVDPSEFPDFATQNDHLEVCFK
nr:GTP-binding protein [Ensifer aridi]